MIVTKEMGAELKDTTMRAPIYLDVKKSPFVLNGFCEPFIRVPDKVAAEVSQEVLRLSKMSAGGRVRFRTDSEYIVVHGDVVKTEMDSSKSELSAKGFSIYFREEGKHIFKGNFSPSQGWGKPYSESRLRFDAQMKDVVIFFPYLSDFSDMYIGLAPGSRLETPSDYTYKKPILFYGSSIVHGIGASTPSTTYPAILSRRLDTDFINLGFAGNAKGEESIFRYMAGLDVSIFVYDYDHNAPTAEHLRRTHYRGYEIFRQGHPHTPIVMASRPDYENMCALRDDPEKEERREIIEQTYLRARAAGDRNVYFVDGSKIYPSRLKTECTFDGCHPNDMGYSFMADAFERVIKTIL